MGSYGRRQFSCLSATEIVAEAHRLAGLLIQFEKGRNACSVERAIDIVADAYGFDRGQLHSLHYRHRDLQDVKGSVVERLRGAFEFIYEIGRRRAALENEIETLINEESHTNDDVSCCYTWDGAQQLRSRSTESVG